MKFTEEQTVKFLELYEREEVLYRLDLKDHKDKNKYNQSLDRIASEMEIDGFDWKAVVMKFKSLRNTYNQEKKKEDGGKKSGSGLDQAYVSNIPWLSSMRRIIERIRPENLQKSNVDELLGSVEGCSQSSQLMNYTEENEELENLSSHGNTVGVRARKRKAADIDKTVETLDLIVKQCQPKPEDQLDSFGRYIVSQLRTLDRNVCLELQDKIQSMVMDAMRNSF